jgi:Predicted integral membrane protein (DUF2269)
VTKLLLSAHVLAAIIAVGPVTVAASMFPPATRRALSAPGDARVLSSVRLLHRICRVYAVVALAVPIFGFATASSMGLLGNAWLIISIILTALAAITLGVLVLPGQTAILATVEAAEPADDASHAAAPALARLGMVTGVFNLLWATVTVLMIVRPGSTTGT